MNLMKSPASVGIIGGADGPTTIFVATSITPWHILAAVAALAGVVALIVYCVRKKKK